MALLESISDKAKKLSEKLSSAYKYVPKTGTEIFGISPTNPLGNIITGTKMFSDKLSSVTSKLSDKTKTTKEKVLAVAEAVPGAITAKAVGQAIAVPKITATMTNADKNRTLLSSEIIKGFNTAKTPEQKKKFADLAVANANYDPSGSLKQLIDEAPKTKQILMSSGELALLAATGYKPYLPTKYVSPSNVKNIKQVVNISKDLSQAESIRKYGNAAKVFDKFIVPTTKAAGEAGTFFALAEGARNADASVNDIIKQGLIGAGVGAGLTAGSIGLVAGLKTAAPVIKEAGSKFMAGVEKAAQPTTSGLVGNTAVEKITNLAGGVKPTLKQRAAQDILQTVQDAQTLKAKFIDRYSALKRIQDKILATKPGGQISQDEKIYNNVRLLESISDNTAETKLTSLMDKLDNFKDIEPDYKAFITNLDLIERSKLGQKTAGGATTEQLIDNLRQLAQEAGPEKMKRLNQARKIINDYHQDWLKARVDAGLISQATVDVLNKAHPNYIPHNVITDVEEQAFNAISGSLNVPKTDIMKAVGSLKNIKDPIEAIALRSQIASRVIEKNKLLNNLVRAQEKYNVVFGMVKLGEKELAKGKTTINLFRDGIKETWVVPQDLAVAIKNLDTPVMPKLFNMAVAPGNLLKRWTTQYNLSFSLPNLFRDKQTAAITAQGFIDDMAKQFGAVPKDISKMSKDDILKLYKESGGYGASIFSDGEQAMLKNLKNRGIVTELSSANPLKLVENVNSALEQNTRLNVFKDALARGLSPQDAALASREATIDFAKMGSWMRPLNRAMPFLNARLQGFVNMGAAVAKNPEMFARMQLFTSVYPTMLLHQHNSRFDSYKNISQKIKDKYWVIVTGETQARDENTGDTITVPQMITIPKGEGQALVSGPVGYFLDKLDGVDKRKVSKMIADTVGAASPFEFSSYGSQGNFLLSQASKFGPVGTIVAGEISNKQPYFGTSIVPESRLKASPYLQYKETTPDLLKMFGEMFTYKDKDGNKVGGISPAKLNFYIESMGGLPKDVKDSLETIYQTVSGGDGAKEKSLSQTTFGALTKTPLARSFAREAAPYYSPEAEAQRELKSNVTEVSTNEALIKKDRAREILKEMNRYETKEERVNYLNSLGDELDKEMKSKINTLKKNNASVEALMKTDSVDIRSRYILSRIDQMKEEGLSKEERVEFIKDLIAKKIITKDVAKRIAELKLDATSNTAP